MSIFAKYNKGNAFDFETPESFEFKNLKDLYSDKMDNTYKMNALFINTKSHFGNAPVVVTDNEMINLPMHLTESVEQMISDSDIVQAVNDGKAGFEIYSYETAKYGTHYSVNFVSIE